jgi:hypothetical protein
MGKGSNTTTTSQNQTYAPAGAGYIQNALNTAQNAAQLPFNIPQAPVAGFSGLQNQAFGLAGNTGIQSPYLNQAQSYFQQGTQPNVSQFFNPMASAVTGQLQNIFGQQAAQNTGSLTQAAGGVGADRIAVGQSELANQQGLAAGQTLANLYQPAVSAALQQESALQGAGYGVAGLGGQAQQANINDVNTLLGSGGLQQQLAQAQLNAPYQQQLAQAAFPYQQSNFLSNAVASLAPGLGGTSYGTGTTTGPSPSLLSQILGGGLAGAGLIGGTGGFGSNGWLTGSNGIFGSGAGQNWNMVSAPGGGTMPMATSARGGAINPYAYDGGGTIPEEPINPGNWMQASAIPQAQLPHIQAHIPQLNLNPPQQSQSGGGGFGQLLQAGLQLGKMFMDTGGSVPHEKMRKFDGHDPYSFFEHRFPQGYADGGSPDDLDTSAGAISGIESGGESNPYATLGPATRTGDRAYGKYQIMGANIPQWTKEATGTAATPQEFLHNPQLQEQTFRTKFGQYTQKYGPEGAARAWFAGEGGMNDPNRRDVLGTSVADYARKFNKAYGNNSGLPSIITQGTDRGMPSAALGYADEAGSDNGGGGGFGDALHSLREGIQNNTPNVFSGNQRTPFAMRSAEMYPGLGLAGAAMAGATQPDVLTGHIPKLQKGQAFPTPPVSRSDLAPLPGATGMPQFDLRPEDINYDGGDEENVPLPEPRPPEAGGTPPGPPMQLHPDEAALPPNAQPTSGEMKPGRKESFIDSPWAALTAAGLGIMGGTSPFAGVNIGQGGLQGLKTLEQQRATQQKQETIDQAAERLAQEAKFHEDQYTRSTPWQQFEMKKPQQIGKNIWGQPVMGVLDQKTNKWMNPATGKEIQPTDLQEADDKIIEDHAQAIAHYQEAPVSPYKMNTPVGAAMMTRARQIAMDEGRTFDMQYYPEAQTTRNKFAAGAQGDTVRSFNTSYRHLDLLDQQIDALNNKDTAAINRIGNAIKTELGLSSAPTNFDAIRNIAMDEVTKAVIGAKGALGDRETNQKTMDAANSPKLLKDVLRKIYKPAMVDQLQSFRQQYVAGTHGGKQSESEFGEKLSPEVREALDQKEQQDAAARQQQGQQGQSWQKAAGQEDAMKQAKAAIAAGKPRAAIIERMKQAGFDTTGL